MVLRELLEHDVFWRVFTLKIDIVCVGKIKERFFRDAVMEYFKRLSVFVRVNIIEVLDEKAPENLSEAQKVIVKNKEGKAILRNIKNNFTIVLDINGKKLSSEDFAAFFQKKALSGISSFTFVIGGSLGLSEEVISTADFTLSFSDMTFPHQLMRVILLEQIYRAFKIINNEPYHK